MNNKDKEKPIIIEITSNHIELGQFLKFANIISTGGFAKSYLLNNVVLVNNSIEHRRGRKLYSDDVVNVENKTYLLKKY